MDLAINRDDPRVVAYYYPQFHQNPLNDRLYGEGFTEWVNVERGIPLFDGHDQPRVPAEELGYYSLGDTTVYAQQVELAREAGVAGFCFYHYWLTGGRRILERPFQAVLDSDIDFPFCLMWANHDWTMAWRGEPQTLSLEMTYAAQDPADFIMDIADALRDPRYIRIDGKPLLQIYEIDGPPNLSILIDGLRVAARDQGIGELHISGTQIRLTSPNRFNPDLDSLSEFPPHGYRERNQAEPPPGAATDSAVQWFDYRKMAAKSLTGINLAPGQKYFRTAVPDWDNTGRRIEQRNPAIFLGSSPDRFGAWVQGLLACAAEESNTLPLVFINAWNEWGECAYLEPDASNGSAYLHALKNATTTWRDAPPRLDVASDLVSHSPETVAELQTSAVATFTPADPPSGPGATVWIDQVQIQQPPFETSTAVFQGLGPVKGLVAHPQVAQLAESVSEHTLYLCSDDEHAFAVTLPAMARPDLVSDNGWLAPENVEAAGFHGWVDFQTVPAGSYELRIPAGDRVGVFKTRIEIAPRKPTDPLPEFNIHKQPQKQRTLFEPGTNYVAAFRPGSAHALVQDFVRGMGAQRVLDCGCADGSFGAQIASDRVEVHGLEYDTISLARAKSQLTSASQADLELPNWTEKAAGLFDALLFIDVLEHVRRPDVVVRQARKLLNPGGSIVTSIPNVAHMSLRLALLAGEWEYQDWGLLDRTHLRFFTQESIEQLFSEAGYEITRLEQTEGPPGVVGAVPPELADWFGELADDPQATAYQYIVQATAATSG